VPILMQNDTAKESTQQREVQRQGHFPWILNVRNKNPQGQKPERPMDQQVSAEKSAEIDRHVFGLFDPSEFLHNS